MIWVYIGIFLAGLFCGTISGIIMIGMLSVNSREEEIRERVACALAERGIKSEDV